MSSMNDMTKNVETLCWRNDRLELLDQRLLPKTTRYLTCTTVAEVASAIKDMVIRGAPAIGCAAAYGIALAAQAQRYERPELFTAALEDAFTLLAESRPTAVNLFWALGKMRAHCHSIQNSTPDETASRLLAKAHQIKADDILCNRIIGQKGATLLANGSFVLTHCNAGALATAGHGTALGVIRSAVESGKSISVLVNETRPYLQGARLTTWELQNADIPVTLITDGMSGHLMQQGKIDAVIIGADRVAANGDVANKIGSYMVAVLAERHHIPFYVACPLSTIDIDCESGSAIPIEERQSSEVTGFAEQQWAPKGMAVCNPAFDITPAELVTAF